MHCTSRYRVAASMVFSTKPRTSLRKAGLSERSRAIEPTSAIRITGTAAMIENRATMRRCSLAPAAPARHAANSDHPSTTTSSSSVRMVSVLAMKRPSTTEGVARTGVKPANIRKEVVATRRARPTAKGPNRVR